MHVDVAEEMQTPPLFPAELTAIPSNILSNATKFAGKGGASVSRRKSSTMCYAFASVATR